MRILLDECVPKRFKAYLIGHEVWTVPEAGWASKKNGALLELAAGQFPVLITVDKDLPHQQNLRGSALMVVVLATEGNELESLLPLVPSLEEALRNLRPGEFVVLRA